MAIFVPCRAGSYCDVLCRAVPCCDQEITCIIETFGSASMLISLSGDNIPGLTDCDQCRKMLLLAVSAYRLLFLSMMVLKNNVLDLCRAVCFSETLISEGVNSNQRPALHLLAAEFFTVSVTLKEMLLLQYILNELGWILLLCQKLLIHHATAIIFSKGEIRKSCLKHIAMQQGWQRNDVVTKILDVDTFSGHLNVMMINQIRTFLLDQHYLVGTVASLMKNADLMSCCRISTHFAFKGRGVHSFQDKTFISEGVNSNMVQISLSPVSLDRLTGCTIMHTY